MAEAAINLTTGQKADRKLDMIFVNVGGSGAETWELLGRGVEDASVEYNHDTGTVTDILGITDVNVSAAKPEYPHGKNRNYHSEPHVSACPQRCRKIKGQRPNEYCANRMTEEQRDHQFCRFVG